MLLMVEVLVCVIKIFYAKMIYALTDLIWQTCFLQVPFSPNLLSHKSHKKVDTCLPPQKNFM